ncbi:MAG: hypothetical protein FJW23_14130 [Acidimicrobiia bacterium]|nr:hypothetical protein [Acidimicrobiia bacterium]
MAANRTAYLASAALLLPLAALTAAPPDGTSQPMVWGRVAAADGTALAGVAVSARPDGATVTRTVYTDADGEFFFPPFQPPFAPGAYSMWAQGVGFERAHTQMTLEDGRAMRADFELDTLEDFSNQLAGSDWMNALPADTHEARRIKEIFRVNCTECHPPGLVLQNRFDLRGWRAIVEAMERVSYHGWTGQGPRATIAYHREELAAYLARVRGPESPPLRFAPRPRPSGEAARVVITEYDIPTSVGKRELAAMDGSHWADGVPSGLHGTGGIHDVQIDNDGHAWLTDSVANEHRTLVRLNPATGAVRAFKLTAPDGRAQTSHGIGRDANGILWFDSGGWLGRIDPATEAFSFYRPPFGAPTTTSGQVDVAPNGTVWMSARRGALSFDPKTETFTFWHDKTIGDGQTYGAAADALGNGWWTQFNMDMVVHADVRTNRTYEIPMDPPDRMEVFLTPEDREFYHNIGGNRFSGTFARPGAQAPRRLSTDRKGGAVWVANWWGGNLARIDAATRAVSYHPVPGDANPYNTVVDRHQMVWTNLMSDDAVARLDPKTGAWTIFRLPSVGTELRHIAVDDRRDEVWVPYREASRAARLQFRTAEDLDAMKQAAQ